MDTIERQQMAREPATRGTLVEAVEVCTSSKTSWARLRRHPDGTAQKGSRTDIRRRAQGRLTASRSSIGGERSGRARSSGSKSIVCHESSRPRRNGARGGDDRNANASSCWRGPGSLLATGAGRRCQVSAFGDTSCDAMADGAARRLALRDMEMVVSSTGLLAGKHRDDGHRARGKGSWRGANCGMEPATA